ncbi:MAG: membrane-bound ClpP family serine protease [Mariniblastus sp.]|jgi:membrane-bound ClpP family serine protease
MLLYWALILLAAGLLVVVVELFLPSAGILGILAGILIVSSIVVGFFDGLFSGALMLLLTVICLPVLLYAMVKLWPHTPLGKRILLKDLKPEDVLPNHSHYENKKLLEGEIGIAKTKMLPSGTVLIQGEKYDAVSEGFAIEAGDLVKVVAVRQNRIYVEPHDGSVSDDLEPSTRAQDILAQPIEGLGLDPIDDPLG